MKIEKLKSGIKNAKKFSKLFSLAFFFVIGWHPNKVRESTDLLKSKNLESSKYSDGR